MFFSKDSKRYTTIDPEKTTNIREAWRQFIEY